MSDDRALGFINCPFYPFKQWRLLVENRLDPFQILLLHEAKQMLHNKIDVQDSSIRLRSGS